MNKIYKGLGLFFSGVGLCLLAACGGSEEPAGVPVQSITIAGEYIDDGTTSQLTAIVSPSEATNKEVEWSVSSELVATISATGLLTAVSNGTVTVTATATDGSGVSADRIIGVSGVEEPPVLVTSITITGSDIADGKSQELSATVLPINADNQELDWSVSDSQIATVDSDGKLTPIANGSVTVRATAKDASGVFGELVMAISGVDETVEGLVVDTAADLLAALDNAVAGDVIYIREGTYQFSSSVRFDNDGQDGNLISVFAYPSDANRPLFDFSSMSENSSNRGIRLSGDYWHVKGIDVYKAGDNGMFISGHNNLVEFCTFYENADTGLQIGNGASNNTVLNCDSYYNADSSIENADGFACKLDAGDGNKFVGCRAWQNLDDGWDGYLRGADNITTIYENCWAFRNGILKNGNVGGGDGNGFKTGGSDDKLLSHHAILKNCIAAGNTVDGFDHNSNRGDITIYNGSAHSNGRNYSFGNGNIANSLIIKNSMSFGGSSGDQLNATTTDITNNSWQDGLQASAADFKSIDIDLLLSPRKADGSLPDIDYLFLEASSDLIDKGVDVGIEFNGSAPDLGAFEF